jgi:hypothetical protein
MALLARNSLVILTALPMLASPGWCCIGWSQLCSSMLTAAGQRVDSQQVGPQVDSSAMPSCCTKRAQANGANALAAGHFGCSDATQGTSAEAGPCRCCEDSRSAAVAPVTKNLVAAPTAIFVAWTLLPTITSAENSPVDIALQDSGPPLRILQCVWRC